MYLTITSFGLVICIAYLEGKEDKEEVVYNIITIESLVLWSFL